MQPAFASFQQAWHPKLHIVFWQIPEIFCKQEVVLHLICRAARDLEEAVQLRVTEPSTSFGNICGD
jgi:hypothetical protein